MNNCLLKYICLNFNGMECNNEVWSSFEWLWIIVKIYILCKLWALVLPKLSYRPNVFSFCNGNKSIFTWFTKPAWTYVGISLFWGFFKLHCDILLYYNRVPSCSRVLTIRKDCHLWVPPLISQSDDNILMTSSLIHHLSEQNRVAVIIRSLTVIVVAGCWLWLVLGLIAYFCVYVFASLCTQEMCPCKNLITVRHADPDCEPWQWQIHPLPSFLLLSISHYLLGCSLSVFFSSTIWSWVHQFKNKWRPV